VKWPEVQAYWISPVNETIPVKDLHIKEVIRDHQRFGYSLEEIRTIHDRYEEALGSEGYAREIIMRALIKDGWIRIRFVPKSHTWTIQAQKDRKDLETVIKEWWTRLSKVDPIVKHTDLKFSTLD